MNAFYFFYFIFVFCMANGIEKEKLNNKKDMIYLCIFEYMALFALKLLTENEISCNNTTGAESIALGSIKFLINLSQKQLKLLMSLVNLCCKKIKKQLMNFMKFVGIEKYLIVFINTISSQMNKIGKMIPRRRLLIFSSILFLFSIIIYKYDV